MSSEGQALPLPDSRYTDLEFPRFTVQGNVSSEHGKHQFATTTTKILGTIKIIYLVIRADLKWFETSAAYMNQAAGQHQWTPRDFMLAVDCILAVCDDQLRQIKQIELELLNIVVRTEPSQGQTLNELLEQVKDDAMTVQSRREHVAEATGLRREDDEMQNKWPAASPTEILYYLVLNTKSCRQRFEHAAADGPSRLRKVIKRLTKLELKDSMADMIGRSTVKPLQQNKISEFDPVMHFFCSGYDKHAKKIHHNATVGSTQERLMSWPKLGEIRATARENHVGNAVSLWGAFMDKLTELQKPTRDKIRESVMETLQPGVSLSRDVQAKIREDQAKTVNELYVKVLKVITGMETAEGLGIEQPFQRLRACTDHLGQAFQKQRDGTLTTNPCCMSCVMNIGYAEAISPKLEEAALQTTAKAYKIDKRRKTPHSCAEVVASMYCDHFPQTMAWMNKHGIGRE
ncbi:hypothetical protein BHE90_013601 [Fusarium euwallaceae]|uniref:Uncharacterized protein n=1 Tax=Fusarium euwallaceae TaxID=1147111 RepID=A0A430L8G0_9HYPO|nr:hypothetical protein BHE90_013601 [Fusarium euwallaceae]